MSHNYDGISFTLVNTLSEYAAFDADDIVCVGAIVKPKSVAFISTSFWKDSIFCNHLILAKHTPTWRVMV